MGTNQLARQLMRLAGIVRCGSGNHPAREYPAMRSHFFVNEEKKFIYVYVPKVASGSLTVWFLSGLGVEKMKKGMHRYANLHFGLGNYSAKEARRLLEECYKFAFVRNPWSRLCSCYVSVFVRGANSGRSPLFSALAQKVDTEICRLSGGTPCGGKTTTFRDFVQYVHGEQEDRRMDVHFRPQSWFVRPESLDFVGRFERLAEDMALIEERVGVKAELPHGHKNPFSETADGSCVADVPSRELFQLEQLPDYHGFYANELRDMVSERYRVDVETFGYDFD